MDKGDRDIFHEGIKVYSLALIIICRFVDLHLSIAVKFSSAFFKDADEAKSISK